MQGTTRRSVGCRTILALVTAWLALAVSDRARADLRTHLNARFADELAEMADACREQGLEELAAETERWIIAKDPRRQYFFLVPRASSQSPAGVDDLERKYHAAFRRLRAEHAVRLFSFAQSALHAGQAATAYRTLFEVLHVDPDHQVARQILGYRRVKDRWETSFGAKKRRSGQVRHPRFGWLREQDVPQYEAGQRKFRGRWVTAEEEDRFRGRIDNGWRVETDHYVVTTNHSLEAGVQLGRQLENLYAVWHQLFVEFYSTQQVLARRLSGATVSLSPPRKFKVTFFRNRDEYNSQLRRIQPQIEMTLGIYLAKQRTAYFFAGDDRSQVTLFHEATHQLFQESRASAASAARDDIGLDGNFWIVEGIALYMESLRVQNGYCTLGGVDTARLQFARHNCLSGGFYESLERLVVTGRQQLQQDERIRLLYSQFAGQAQFLMDSKGGYYRRPLVKYLRAIYTRQDHAGTLEDVTGVELGRIDDEYREFLNVTDQDLRHAGSQVPVERLLLGHTHVGDPGVTHLPGLTGLIGLNLAATRITDVALETIGGWHALEELDLSGTRITDPGLRHLAELKKLRILLLSGNRISDDGLQHLAGLSALEQLDVSDTQVTAGGIAELQRRLPAVKVTK